jgi:creatinine amidohydrolase
MLDESPGAGVGAGGSFGASDPMTGPTTEPMTLPAPRKWEEQAWPDLQDLATEGEGEVGMVPVGATEQHGPHLPTGTDTIIATALCNLASQHTGAPVLPAIAVACSYGHGTAMPGTLSLTPQLLAAVAVQYAEWAATSGLTRLIFVNAHFGNAASLGTATDHLRLFRPDLRVAAVDWWSLDAEVARETTVDGDDIHANRAETSVMLALAPHLVDLEKARTADDADRTGGLVFRYTAPALSLNGVTGRPSEATPELGSRLVERTVNALAARIRKGRTEKPPLGAALFPPFPRSFPR